jgi:hypothetical protein
MTCKNRALVGRSLVSGSTPFPAGARRVRKTRAGLATGEDPERFGEFTLGGGLDIVLGSLEGPALLHERSGAVTSARRV